MEKVKLGKVIEIEGLNIKIEITEKTVSEKINYRIGSQISPVIINKLVSIPLLNGQEIIGKIEKMYDNSHLYSQDYLKKNESKICVECSLIGIYNFYLKTFDEGIVNFPLINTEVYSVTPEIKKNIVKLESEYRLKIGNSYNENEVEVFANPDILLGKHLGIFGNTGTGKSCTVASIIQGLKKRVYDKNNNLINVKPKIIIFDSNNEYERAFNGSGISYKIIKKEELKLPHTELSDSEYYKLFGASQGVQVPMLKEALSKLTENYTIKNIIDKIKAICTERVGNNNYNLNQMMGWLNTMLIRMERVAENSTLNNIVENVNQNTIDVIINGTEEIFLIDSDFDKEELDVIMYLFAKIVYTKCKNKNIVLVLEEAHRYINEEETSEYKLGNYYIQKIAREGRKFGISLIVSSQRPSELSKSIISQCNSFIIHKLTNKNDNDLIYRVLSNKSKGYLNMLSGLEKQHALVCGEAFGFVDIVKIETANPTPKSDDPQVIKKWMD